MITRSQAMSENLFHEEGSRRRDGSCYVWRRNGRTQTWKRDPSRFRVPVKYGIRSYAQLTELNAGQFHIADDCPGVTT